MIGLLEKKGKSITAEKSTSGRNPSKGGRMRGRAQRREGFALLSD